jgi:hypothetical protein
MNGFRHKKSGKEVAMNYKVMYTFFNYNEKFFKIYSGSHLIEVNRRVIPDVLLVRNPFDKFASFYSNKIAQGKCVTLHPDFVSKLSSKFGFDVSSSTKEEIAEKIPLTAFVDSLGDLFMDEPHLYPQVYCLRWITPWRIVRIESELSVLTEMFPDIDFSVKKNESEKKTILDDEARSVVAKIYHEDFVRFYPDLIVF